MKKTYLIAARELRSYFDSPVAYIVIVAFLLVAGWVFFTSLFRSGQADLRGFFFPAPLFSPPWLLFLLAPVISMRLVAEERKTGTIELLTSMPVRNSQVILGKFLAAVALMAIALALTIVFAITVSAIGPLDWGPVLSGYLGILLFGATLLAIGLACSTWTDSQIIAFIVAILICGALYYIYWLQLFVPEWLGKMADFVSVSSHLNNMARGVIDSRDVLYYLTLTAAALFVAERSLARQRA